MKFNQLYASFPKLLETLASPFSSRKRKREQADALDDSLSARPAKQAPVAQFSSHPAPAVSHQSNTRGPVTAARTQFSLPQPADPYREATSQSAQITPSPKPASGSTLQQLQPSGRPAASNPREPPNQEKGLRSQLEALRKQMAELEEQMGKEQENPAKGATINLREREQYGKLVELSKRQDAQTAMQHNIRHQTPKPDSPIVLDDAEETPMPSHAHAHSWQQPQYHSSQQHWSRKQLPNQHRAAAQDAHAPSPGDRFQLNPSAAFSPAARSSPYLGPNFMPTAASRSPFVQSPAHPFRSPQFGRQSQIPRQKPTAELPSPKLTQAMQELFLHVPYNPQASLPSNASKQHLPASSAAEQDLDEVLARARSMTIASQSSMRAATEQAEHIKDHKSLIRKFQTAAQPPLPQEDAKGAPTAAQQRPRTAAEPQKGVKGKQAESVRARRRDEEVEEVIDEVGSVEYEEDGYDDEDGVEDGSESALDSSEQEQSGLSEAFSELGPRAGRLEPVRKPSKVMLQHKEKAFADGPDNEKLVVHVHSGVDVTRKDIRTLKPRQWLNDEVMNCYMGLLQERDVRMRKLGGFPKCHFFNTFFINKLYKDDKKYCYNNVRRWTSKMRLDRWGQPSATVLECDKLIIPVHLGCHWTCAVVNLKEKEIWYFDSLGGKEYQIVESLAQYAADEYNNKLQQKVDTSDWARRLPDDIPKQLNGCDCGVFALMFAEYQARDAPFTFDQRHMEYYRLKVVADIMSLQVDVPRKSTL